MPTPKQTARAIGSILEPTFEATTPQANKFLRETEATYGTDTTRKVIDYIESTLGIKPSVPEFEEKARDAIKVLEDSGRIKPVRPTGMADQASQILEEARSPAPPPVGAGSIPETASMRTGGPGFMTPAPGAPSGPLPTARQEAPLIPGGDMRPPELRRGTLLGTAGATAGFGALAAGDQPQAAATTPPAPPPSRPAGPPTQPPGRDEGEVPPKGGEKDVDKTKRPPSAAVKQALDGILTGLKPLPKRPDEEAPAYEDPRQYDPQLEDARIQLTKETNQAFDDLKEAKSEVRRQEIWERIIKGVSHLFAGWYGAKNNVAITNLDIPLSDFTKKEELALAEHAAAIRAAAARHAATREELLDRKQSLEDYNKSIERGAAQRRQQWQDAMVVAEANNKAVMDKATLALNRYRAEQEAAESANRHEMNLQELGIKQKYYESLGDREAAQAAKAAQTAATRARIDLERAIGDARGAPDEISKDKALAKAYGAHARYAEATGGPGLLPEATLNSTSPEEWEAAFRAAVGPRAPALSAGPAAESAPGPIPPPPGTARVVMPDGRSGTIPEDQVDAFLAKNRGARRAD